MLMSSQSALSYSSSSSMIEVAFVSRSYMNKKIAREGASVLTSFTHDERFSQVVRGELAELTCTAALQHNNKSTIINSVTTIQCPTFNINLLLLFFCVMSDNEIQPEDRPSTWTSRNPEKPVIQPRVQPKKTPTASQKITNTEKQAMKHESALAFQQVITDFNARRDAFIDKAAKDNNKKPAYVRSLLLSKTKVAKPRQVNLHNALVHHVAKELNAGM